MKSLTGLTSTGWVGLALALALGSAQPLRADRYGGGPGSGYAMREATFSLGGSPVTLALAASAVLAREPGGAAVALPVITVADHATAPVITTAGGIRIGLPVSLRLTWDPTVTAPAFGGSAAGKVASPVSYADAGRTLVVAVTDGFAAGDTLTLTGLAVTNRLAAARPAGLELNIRGQAGQPDAYSVETVAVTVPRPGGPGQGYAMNTMMQDMRIVARGSQLIVR